MIFMSYFFLSIAVVLHVLYVVHVFVSSLCTLDQSSSCLYLLFKIFRCGRFWCAVTMIANFPFLFR
jgi:hypothetical protein